MNKFDAVIAGAGPAGLSTALKLQAAGWRVLVVEKCKVPRDKVCGGFVGPENILFLKELGIYEKLKQRGAEEINNVVLSSSRGKKVRIPISLNGSALPGLALSRKLLDGTLLEAFVARGGSVLDEHALENASREGLFKIRIKNLKTGSEAMVYANQFIRATGLRNSAGIKDEKMFWGISAMFKNVKNMEDHVFLHLIDKGHLGINRFEDNVVNVCYVADGDLVKSFAGDLEGLFDHFKGANPVITEQLESAQRVTTWKGIPVARKIPYEFAKDGAFYAGDTVGVVHPIVGGGISLALSMGYELASLLTAHESESVPHEKVLHAYRKVWHKKYFWRLRASGMMGRLSHCKPAADVILHLMSSRSDLMEAFFKFHHRSLGSVEIADLTVCRR
ncbi:MAG: NAD(P)/FAD-dependent oxidoreductase [Candidatus Omnitrophica bacterium]|nr:NAD(P)/FAD-dependent oxidoreductase [Candidatus Omnitrophota bacterium]